MRSFIIIPARYASTRLPRKMLLDATGKPLICHTVEAATTARLPEGVIVACDHQEIFDAVSKAGHRAVMTDPNAASGTDRIAEVARTLDGIDIIVNVQGDEPMMSGETIDQVVQKLIDSPEAVMATIATPIRCREHLEDPACVKVVFDRSGRALYFSRSVIPHPRTWDSALLSAEPAIFYQHLGLYAYRRDFLLRLSSLPQSDAERTESLEQLRVLDQGYSLLVGVVEQATFGIDTWEDYENFVKMLDFHKT